jgi:uncharacterized protein YgiM (DUF1202 family)
VDFKSLTEVKLDLPGSKNLVPQERRVRLAMERNAKTFGVNQFRVKYKETALYLGPSAISGYIGTLHKGAVLTVVGDDHPYFYRVQMDNGLEGYVYKASGELSAGLSPTRFGPIEIAESPNGAEPIESANGVIPEATPEKPVRQTRVRPATTTTRSTSRSTGSTSSYSSTSNGARGAASSRAARAVVVTSGEIAVFDKPGIVGQQVGRLRRGAKVPVLAQDGFFYQVELTSGQVGYIPRFAAEEVDA